MTATRRRVTILAVVVVLLAAGALADRVARPAPEGDRSIAVAAGMPTAAPLTASSSTWFCAGGTAAAGGAADAVVHVANPTARQATGTVTVVPLEGDAKAVPFTVAPNARTSVRLGDHAPAAYAAATVDLDGGGLVVEQQVNGPRGVSAAPCAATGSDRWHVADGSTAREDSMVLALYNPFPEDAIADLSFSTDQGRAVPSHFQGIVVRSGRLAVVNVGDHVRRRTRVAGTVRTRSGRVVTARLQLRGGATPGMSLALAAPSPAPEWWFPEGYVGDGVAERFSVFNPTDDEAIVSLELVLADGQAAEPFDLTVPARDRVEVVANDEERVPKNAPHSAVVRSQNGVPVVAERAVTVGAPSGRVGTVETLGARRAARRWVLAAGGATERLDEWVSVLNPNPAPVTVSFRVLAAGQPIDILGLQDTPIPAGSRASFRITDHIRREDVPLLVEAAGGTVVVERALYAVGSPGVSLTVGIPLR